jgi:hypothetical protein
MTCRLETEEECRWRKQHEVYPISTLEEEYRRRIGREGKEGRRENG